VKTAKKNAKVGIEPVLYIVTGILIGSVFSVELLLLALIYCWVSAMPVLTVRFSNIGGWRLKYGANIKYANFEYEVLFFYKKIQSPGMGLAAYNFSAYGDKCRTGESLCRHFNILRNISAEADTILLGAKSAFECAAIGSHFG
jgi:hypothetical protein